MAAICTVKPDEMLPTSITRPPTRTILSASLNASGTPATSSTTSGHPAAQLAHALVARLGVGVLAHIDRFVGAESTRLAQPQIDAIDRDHARAARLRDRHRMQPESAGAEHDDRLAVGEPRAIETPEHLRHRAIRRRRDQVGHVVGDRGRRC